MGTDDTAAQILDRHGFNGDSASTSACKIPWGKQTQLLFALPSGTGGWVAVLRDATEAFATGAAHVAPIIAKDRGASKREAAERTLDEFIKNN